MFFSAVFGDLGRLPSVCKGYLSVKSAPKLMKLVNDDTQILKDLCSRIDLSQLGKDMFKLSMLDFEKKGADNKTLTEFLPMFKLIVKVIEPVRPLPGLPEVIGLYFDDISQMGKGADEEIFKRASQKAVFEPIMKFLMDIRAQELLLGTESSFLFIHILQKYLLWNSG